MNLDRAKALKVFRKVKQVREEIAAYCLSHDRSVLPVEDYQRIVAQMYLLEIEKVEVAFEGTFLRGLVERYPHRARIIVQKNQGEDWKRFTAVKELCHLVNDEQEDWSIDGVHTIKEMLLEYHVDSSRPGLAEVVTQSEIFAEIAAVELLYPFSQRKLDVVSMVEDPSFTFAKIAGYHKLPEYFVDLALTPWYHKMTMDLWNCVDD